MKEKAASIPIHGTRQPNFYLKRSFLAFQSHHDVK